MTKNSEYVYKIESTGMLIDKKISFSSNNIKLQ